MTEPAANNLTAAEPVAVTLDPKKAAFVVMDIADPFCTKRPACVESVPRIAALLQRAREAGVPVVYTLAPKPSVIFDEVAPLDSEPVITGRADKFFDTELHEILTDLGAKTLIMVGTAANGAVMYSAFSANLRGYTVVVAADAIASDDEAATEFVKWQLLNQPGMNNPDNAPLTESRVTLSSTDLIEFYS